MKKLKQILLSLITNPLLLIAYGFFSNKLAEICKYGRRKKTQKGNSFLATPHPFFILPGPNYYPAEKSGWLWCDKTDLSPTCLPPMIIPLLEGK